MNFLAANKNSILNLRVDAANHSSLMQPLPQTAEDQLKQSSLGGP